MMTAKPPMVWLIHGTNAGAEDDDGQKWWQRGSTFWNEFNRQIDGVAECGHLPDGHLFHWSGNNSESARKTAGIRLCELLRKQGMDESPVHLIGHSHGGSAIWHALCEAARCGEKLPCLKSWTSIGTPFLHHRPRYLDLCFVLPLLAACGAIYTVWPWTIDFNREASFQLWTTTFKVILLSVLVSLLIGYFVICGLRVLRVMGLTLSLAAKRRHANLAISTFADRYLGIWSPDDEAINGLRKSLPHLTGTLSPRVPPVLELWPLVSFSQYMLLPWRVILRSVAALTHNRVIAPLVDAWFYGKLTMRLQGNDFSGRQLTNVTRGPNPDYEYGPLPAGVVRALRAQADAFAARLSSYVRDELALAGDSVPLVFERLGKNMTGEELVHCSYYDNASVQLLLAMHVGAATAATNDDLQDAQQLRGWLREHHEQFCNPVPHRPAEQATGPSGQGADEANKVVVTAMSHLLRRLDVWMLGPISSAMRGLIVLLLVFSLPLLVPFLAWFLLGDHTTTYQIDMMVDSAPVLDVAAGDTSDNSQLIIARWGGALARAGRLEHLWSPVRQIYHDEARAHALAEIAEKLFTENSPAGAERFVQEVEFIKSPLARANAYARLAEIHLGHEQPVASLTLVKKSLSAAMLEEPRLVPPGLTRVVSRLMGRVDLTSILDDLKAIQKNTQLSPYDQSVIAELLVYSLLSTGNTKEADQQIDAIRRTPIVNPEALFGTLLATGQLAEARIQVDSRPDSEYKIEPLLELAKAYADEARHDDAELIFDKALQLYQTHAEPYAGAYSEARFEAAFARADQLRRFNNRIPIGLSGEAKSVLTSQLKLDDFVATVEVPKIGDALRDLLLLAQAYSWRDDLRNVSAIAQKSIELASRIKAPARQGSGGQSPGLPLNYDRENAADMLVEIGKTLPIAGDKELHLRLVKSSLELVSDAAKFELSPPPQKVVTPIPPGGAAPGTVLYSESYMPGGGDPVASTLAGISELQAELGLKAEALTTLQIAQTKADQMQSEETRSRYLLGIAVAYAKVGRFRQAREVADRCQSQDQLQAYAAIVNEIYSDGADDGFFEEIILNER